MIWTGTQRLAKILCWYLCIHKCVLIMWIFVYMSKYVYVYSLPPWNSLPALFPCLAPTGMPSVCMFVRMWILILSVYVSFTHSLLWNLHSVLLLNFLQPMLFHVCLASHAVHAAGGEHHVSPVHSPSGGHLDCPNFLPPQHTPSFTAYGRFCSRISTKIVKLLFSCLLLMRILMKIGLL